MKFIATLILTIIVFTAYGQVADNTNRHNDKNIYYQALAMCFNSNSKDTLHHQKSDTFFVRGSNYYLLDSVLNHSGSTHFIVVNDVYEFLKQRKIKKLTLYEVFPLEYKQGEFSVSLNEYEVDMKKTTKRHTYLAVGSGYKIFFKFDKDEFHYVRIEGWGI